MDSGINDIFSAVTSFLKDDPYAVIFITAISVFVNLLVITGLFRKKILNIRKRNFWRPIKEDKLWTVVSPEYEDKRARVEDVRSIEYISKNLSKLDYKYETVFSRKPHNAHNIIYICGPYANISSKNFIKKNNFRFSINNDNNGIPRIIDNKKNHEYISSQDDTNTSESYDYCIIGKNTNEEENTKSIFIFGIHGIGTYGGASYLASDSFFKDKYFKKIKDKDFILVLKVFHDGNMKISKSHIERETIWTGKDIVC